MILYKSVKVTAHMEFGNKYEDTVIERVCTHFRIKSEKCGVFVDTENGCLAATPDAIVGTDGIIEVKCTPSVAGEGLHAAAARKKPNFCLRLTDDGNLQLSRRHGYYYQIQGQLNITKRDVCYFGVMSDVNEPMHFEKIQRDTQFWENTMLPALLQFYRDAVLPEIVDPRSPRGLPIREPYTST